MIQRRLTEEMIFKLTHHKNLKIKKELAQRLGLTMAGISRSMQRNPANSVLTTETSLEYLEKKFKMSRNQMLETKEEGKEE
jgi:hypothetical protein